MKRGAIDGDLGTYRRPLQGLPPAGDAAADDGGAGIDLMVRADKLSLLFHQSFPALFISLVAAGMLAWMLWGHADSAAVLAWLALLTVSTLGRLAIFLAYFRHEPSGLDLLRWEKPYVITLLASSLVWGIGALLVMPRDSLLHQAITLFVLLGMAGGAVSTYSARRLMAVAAMTSVLLPSTLWLLFQPGREQIGMAVGALMFMAASLRATKVLATALHRNFQLTRELMAAHEAADFLAKTDALTGINNRRAFFERGEQIASYCERHGEALSALVMDVDRFKAINDSLGHSVGDVVLQQVGERLRHAFRQSDVCGRLGGEEFAVLLPHTAGDDAWDIAEKLRQAVAETPLAYAGQPIHVTISIGVATAVYDLKTLLHHADTAMYQAKAQGRDCVVRYGTARQASTASAGES